jgi:hypothetical protein
MGNKRTDILLCIQVDIDISGAGFLAGICIARPINTAIKDSLVISGNILKSTTHTTVL